MNEATISKSDNQIKSIVNSYKNTGLFKGFPSGKKIPNFEAPNSDNNLVNIYNSIDRFAVISFIRGDWSKHCVNELIDLRDNYEKIHELGAKVIIISPQKPERLEKLKSDLNLPFEILSDQNLDIANAFNLVWDLPNDLKNLYLNEYQIDISEKNANNSWQLPVPATYIINENGDIIAKTEDFDHTNRMPAKTIIRVLNNNQIMI